MYYYVLISTISKARVIFLIPLVLSNQGILRALFIYLLTHLLTFTESEMVSVKAVIRSPDQREATSATTQAPSLIQAMPSIKFRLPKELKGAMWTFQSVLSDPWGKV